VTTRRLALVGLLGPPFFAAIVVAVTAIEWDFLHDLGWSAAPLSSPNVPWPSSAALGASGWLLSLGFLLLGAAILSLAVALFRLLRRRRWVGPALLALVGVGALCAAFSTDYGSAGGGGPETWNGTLHALGITIVVFGSIAAMLALGVRFGREDRWRIAGWTSFAAAGVAFASLFAYLAGGGIVFYFLFLTDILVWLTLAARRVYDLAAEDVAREVQDGGRAVPA
jgi:MFS family permease